MNTSVGMKARKKQSSLSVSTAPAISDQELEHSLLPLENACVRILESRFGNGRQDTDRLYWQQRFKNIVTPVWLALAECKGPRRFHYHYRHRPEDETILHPVLEPSPIATLAQVCKDALDQCQTQLVGIEDDVIIETRNLLESALGNFLQRYREYAA